MMTWMEMVGLSRFALYLSSCPCSLLGSGTELPSPTGCFYAAYIWGTQGPLVSVEGDPTAHSPFEQPWVFLELYISAGNYGGITSSSGLSGLCLCKASVFQIIPLCIPGILLLHEGTGSEEWNERASSRATGYSPWVRFLLQESGISQEMWASPGCSGIAVEARWLLCQAPESTEGASHCGLCDWHLRSNLEIRSLTGLED